MTRQEGQELYDRDTVALTATYLSSRSVHFPEQAEQRAPVEGSIEEIPFQEQDDPPDSLLDGCPDAS